MSRLLFITGTDTGVGKTLLTALLLHHCRTRGMNALAIKPFSCGGTEDAEALAAIQGNALKLNEVSPVQFAQPLAPYAAARAVGLAVDFADADRGVREARRKCDLLLVEGVGGALVPLGRRLFLADWFAKFRCPGLLVAANRLGVLNHVLLSVEAMRRRGMRRIAVVLSGQPAEDGSAKSNPEVLRELLAPLPILELPYLGARALAPQRVKKNAGRLEKTLARLAEFASLPARCREAGATSVRKAAKKDR